MALHPKEARFIYRGRNEIQKSNLKMMIKELEVPVKYDPFFTDEPDLLITVDCQYGSRNVTQLKAPKVGIIDHHQEDRHIKELKLEFCQDA